MKLKRAIQQALGSAGYQIIKIKSFNTYYQDGLRTRHNHEFTNDSRFARAYARGVAGAQGQDMHHGPWRVHIATWAAETALRRGGDFVECGVYLGFVSSVVMTYVDWNSIAGERRFFLLDSFEGLSPDLLTPEELAMGRANQFGDHYSDTYDRAAKNVSEFRRVEIIKGVIPATLQNVKTDRIAYLHIDMNSAAPEVAALRFFWNKLVPGAIVLLDDYAYEGFTPQKHAMDKLAAELGFSIASLPTGQGLVVK